MSLVDSWKNYLEGLDLRMDHSEAFRQEIAERRRAFYAGAEAAYFAWNSGHSPEECREKMKTLQAEIAQGYKLS